ncbi:hypothetical protein VKT23_002497 [Stygiomarasmius scandens]|uniref:Heterokaryon incompatibility domain-containing protein n=1 Tax=Marasmiellus scandens TaxID=2682957 RepID=A0ABR1K3H6_9AGAR
MWAVVWDEDLQGKDIEFGTRRWAELLESANNCQLCRLLCMDIPEEWKETLSTDDTFFVKLGFRRHTLHGLVLQIEAHMGSRTYFVCATEDNVSARYIATREVVTPTDIDTCVSYTFKCVEGCSNHDKCPRSAPATLPTRVLDCSDPTQPRLIISDSSMREYYVALSYVWGEDQPHRTTVENIDTYTTLIDQSFIPKTIRDGIMVTHKLGLRYLWVDSFCIMQDSDDDKAQEIAKIRTYFSHAFITIIAASAERVSEGFLHEHPKWNRTPILLPFRCPDGPIGTVRLYKDEVPPYEAIEERAWCLEERVLSPRCLLFCSHAVQYECPTERKNINGSPLLLEILSTQLPVTTFDSDQETLDRSWHRLLLDYTARKLTKPKDKLDAFGGIAEFFHGLWPDSRYVAGMWTHQFPEALLWISKGEPRTVYLAPSWSWAAVDGAIHSSTFIKDFDAPAITVLCSVKRYEATLKRKSNPYGEVTSGLLVLEAGFMQAIWEPDPRNLWPLLYRVKEDGESYSVQDHLGYYFADTTEFWETRHEVSLVALLESNNSVYGLVLIPVQDQEVDGEKVYRRIGMFTLTPALKWSSNTSNRTIHIV